MKTSEFLKIYSNDPLIQSLNADLHAHTAKKFRISGHKGSFANIIAASLYYINPVPQLHIVSDREQAMYVANDLQQLLNPKEIHVFPMSYKKPYEFADIDNANVLQRAEVLSRLNMNEKNGEIIITYAEALTEKVISKKKLIENTLLIKIGEALEIDFLSELLVSYDFEATDFVYEPGQFAIRGGIVDIFSFSYELPYRIELFDNQVESIRTFSPATQLSIESKKVISIIPNVQNKTMHTSAHFLDFFPKESHIFIDDIDELKRILDTYYQKATEAQKLLEKQKVPQNLVPHPEEKYETYEVVFELLSQHNLIETGQKNILKHAKEYTFSTHSQPNFNKNFTLLSQNLLENQTKGYTNLILTESPTQFDKLEAIFEEICPQVKIHTLNCALKEGFTDLNLKIACYTDHQIFGRYFNYKQKEKFTKSKALTIKELRQLHPGDYVTHADYGIAKFVGLEKVTINDAQQEAIRLLFKDNDLMKVSILQLHKISKYSGKEGTVPQMSKLGSQDWDNKKKAVKKKVRELAIDLIRLYAKRKAAPGFAYSPDTYLQAELETSFIYEDTPDQAKATIDVKTDMEKPHPMDRLVCGDVGFGKTEVAIRAAFKAATDSRQTAVLVPTTILAMQHYKTFKERLANLPVRVEYISRFRSASQIRDTLQRISDGKTEILIGTHKMLSDKIKFKNLGLLIIDEEQKFGVAAKEKIREMRINIDTLTLTATPIPRTLHFSLMGARDLSIINTPPPNRQPVTTEVHTYSEELIRDAVNYEIKRGGQCFVVHNRVSDLYSIADTVKKLVPDAKVAVAHGQMEGDELENVMVKFIQGEYDVLVSTNIIESGLDIPNANTIIINRAQHFGLSDLHQMRGRVGRSNKKAYCYLLTPPKDMLNGDSKKKLSALEEFSDLGDGFKVAMRDLDIRGAGDLLGGEQSGFITDIGFEMYHKLLDEAVQELKETEFKDLFDAHTAQKQAIIQDCILETDISMIIPDSYVSNISERLAIYNELDNIENEQKLLPFVSSLTDRFGPLPLEVNALIQMVKIRWLAQKLGFDKLLLKQSTLKCQFASNSGSDYYNGEIFGKILSYVQSHPKACTLSDNKNRLFFTVQNIDSISSAMGLLHEFE
ncbi:MAG: transcription-repair coupling factor [Cytophagales bacterium]|nr:transcription-repair coupling factor [Cytophagales bacterium]